ncbi:MAG: hypothetical protein U0793_06735 [Gemmataceae bacterium]
MPLLDPFHPPLHGTRRWEGFHHSWATFIAKELNQGVLPSDYFAESEISLGPGVEIDVATLELPGGRVGKGEGTVAVWTPGKPKIATPVSFAHLESFEVKVFQDLGGGAELRAAIELISPANKDRRRSRLTFAAKCVGYLRNGIGLVIVDVVTSRNANLHDDLFRLLGVSKPAAFWRSPTGLYAVGYRACTGRKKPRLEGWPTALTLGKTLPTVPLWLAADLCVPLDLEASYVETCAGLRIAV